MSSVVGHMGNAGQIPYTMEKAALDAFTKSLAKEFSGRNILVNSIAPGFIDTDMTMELPKEIRDGILEREYPWDEWDNLKKSPMSWHFWRRGARISTAASSM